ncbi:SMP-30/gluconolactonase/LRE family protein [Puniceibacterium sediminis]|uniref:Sugar lactone lactonase YvrE n=1 Tax=Puniceibacterium sediminis TaxID=1608407 RepID=A0A238ZDK7_9RHOB|nr:SMP-30/gluconolactonase/LRE family protein [Puniceibacterium sediminis]SNR81179.1 Sugar lactone lactonase YvrE [Puniceibacterium sediminis]
MKNPVIEVAHRAAAQLGETPLWDARAQRLRWIDIEKPTLYSLDPETGATDATEQPGTYLGGIALTRSGGVLLARDLTLVTASADGTNARVLAVTPDETHPDTRLNDGRVDCHGQLWIGTMDNELHRSIGGLYRVDPDGTMTRHFSDVVVSNGIAFAPDGRRMWFTDTRRHLTWTITLDETGAPTSRGLLSDFTATADRPDGACVDADGCLWQAVFAGGRIIRYAPDGRIDREIALPVSNPTCLCFGGPDLKTLFVTTATKFLPPDVLAAEPLAGSVLAIQGLGQGLPEHLFDA